MIFLTKGVLPNCSVIKSGNEANMVMRKIYILIYDTHIIAEMKRKFISFAYTSA